MEERFKEMMIEKSFEFTKKFRDELMNVDHLNNLFKSMSDDELHIAVVGLQALISADSPGIASQWVKAFIGMNNKLLLEEYENSKKAAIELEQKYGSSSLAAVYRQMVENGSKEFVAMLTIAIIQEGIRKAKHENREEENRSGSQD